jgi:hypothetical protein
MPRTPHTQPPRPDPKRPDLKRDVGKEIDRVIPSPDVARRAAEDIEAHDTEKRSGDPGFHERTFGQDEDAAGVDDTPPGAGRREVNIIGTAVEPEGNQPMRNVGDTDQGDRQPDGGRRR